MPSDLRDVTAEGHPLSVTVITPSFNQARFLRATLESVAEQDYPNIEHIVLDGGSDDGSVALLRDWANSHAISWRTGPDGGQAAAIQDGIRMATGDIVTWLNSDDVYLDRSAISAIVARFESEVAVVTGAGCYISEDGRRLRTIPVYPSRLGFETLRWVDWVLQPATFFRRDVVRRYPIDTTLSYAFDWDLFIRLSREHTFATIDREVAGYRLHQGGKTVSGASRRQQELLTVSGRYNSHRSLRYRALRAFAALHRSAERLPRPLYRATAVSLDRFAMIVNRLAGGRGIQI